MLGDVAYIEGHDLINIDTQAFTFNVPLLGVSDVLYYIDKPVAYLFGYALNVTTPIDEAKGLLNILQYRFAYLRVDCSVEKCIQYIEIAQVLKQNILQDIRRIQLVDTTIDNLSLVQPITNRLEASFIKYIVLGLFRNSSRYSKLYSILPKSLTQLE